MFHYLVRRLLVSIPILLGITLIVFLIASKMPGDAVLAMISNETPQAEDLIKLRRGQLGLDLPVWQQYGRWLWQLLHGHLGYSFQSGEPVSAVIAARLPATVQLMGVALLFAIVVGVTLGVVSALRQYSWVDYSFTLFGFAGVSIPDFFLGMVLVYVFAIELHLLPTSGFGTAGEAYSLTDNLRHLLLPALALGLARTAVFMRYTRASVLEVMNNDHVRTARAKGLREWRVIARHVLRNALVPVVTVIGLSLPVLFGGAVIIETIFQWAGIGLMFINAVTGRDSPVIMGYVLLSAVMVLVSNLLTDVAYASLDPRIRFD
ncbi:ABC transporter permease [Leptothrix discophora]|uniref:ABC transporter permease n=1 Tax=Leptothrix discophora TaxID=89 RepID=A0ABT9G2X7_LEPDI|nr:ABC transporter permease [Leptothrix discophora]MDP4300818.1 ABC transporter permease [Leptothrix discophora]